MKTHTYHTLLGVHEENMFTPMQPSAHHLGLHNKLPTHLISGNAVWDIGCTTTLWTLRGSSWAELVVVEQEDSGGNLWKKKLSLSPMEQLGHTSILSPQITRPCEGETLSPQNTWPGEGETLSPQNTWPGDGETLPPQNTWPGEGETLSPQITWLGD
jgi:hypothetical protein